MSATPADPSAEDLAPHQSPFCFAAAARVPGFTMPLPALDDEDGPRLPASLSPVVDAHVHLFPDRLFDAVWRWFDAHGWPIRHKLYSPDVIAFLLSRGVERIVALHYAHKPGIARGMNAYMAGLVASEPRVVGLATVFPGEPGAEAILGEAFSAGLAGVKLHCHVQCFAPDEDALRPVYEACARAGKPLVMHAGREPRSPRYLCDPHALCSVERVERVLQDHPTLKLVVPHLGVDEHESYERLLTRHDNLWLDTTMVLADYLPWRIPPRLLQVRPERILYGTDFPNLPYAWDREITKLLEMDLRDDALTSILGASASRLYGLEH